VRSGAHNAPLDAFLAEANDRVRRVFGGSVTYVSVPLETVDWSRFDFVSADLYCEARIRDEFTGIVGRYLAHGRPIAVTEFGCCTYRGAAGAQTPVATGVPHGGKALRVSEALLPRSVIQAR
jgi:hypothetical protein